MEVRTFARYSNIAALVRSERVPTLVMVMPRLSAPIDLTADMMCFLTCVDVIRASLLPVQNVFTVVCSVVLG